MKFLCQGLLAVVCTLRAMHAASCAAETDLICELDIARGGDIIVAPVTIRGETYAFIVDTGSTYCCLQERHGPLAGEKTGSRAARTPAGSQSYELYAAPDMRIRNTALRTSGKVACVNLADVDENAGVAIDGILGMDALKHLVLTLDFDHGKIRIMKSVANPTGKPVSLTWHGLNGPFIAAKIDSRLPAEFLIDTGAMRHNLGSLDPMAFDLLHTAGRLTLLPGSYSWFSLGKKVDTRLGRLDSVDFGSFQHANVTVERVPFWNSLGIGFLARYICTFDFPNNVLYLQPGERFAAPDAMDGSGLHLRRSKGEVVIERVLKGDAGDAAGIRPGDALLSVDGEPVKGWSIYRIEERFCIPGERALIVRRNRTEHSIRLSIPAEPKRDDTVRTDDGRKAEGRIKLLFD